MPNNLDQEKDACGVGCVIRPELSHETLEIGLAALAANQHRGAMVDGKTGDGAGIMTQIPWKMFNKHLKTQGITRAKGEYGVGMILLPKDDAARIEAEAMIAWALKEVNPQATLFAWRDVAVDCSLLSERAKSNRPVMRQCFVQRPQGMDDAAFERTLHRAQVKIQEEAARSPDPGIAGTFVASLSGNRIIYKGLLQPRQVKPFFTDLNDRDFETRYVMFHSRFSTNTLPSWEGAHPYRLISHNGEINTRKTNEAKWDATMAAMKTPFAFNTKLADSGRFDQVLSSLAYEHGYPVEEALLLMMPPAWQQDRRLPEHVRSMLEYMSHIISPFDGPAHMVYCDGNKIGAHLDRSGLRPSRTMLLKDGTLVIGSEMGIVEVADPEQIEQFGRVGAGEILSVDIASGKITPHEETLHRLAGNRNYGQLLKDSASSMAETVHIEKSGAADFRNKLTASLPYGDQRALAEQDGEKEREASILPPHYARIVNALGHNDRLRAYGWSDELDERFVLPMALTGKELVVAMGDDTPPAFLSRHPWHVSHYMKQLFAQVTNPPIDWQREDLNMSLRVALGPELLPGRRRVIGSKPQHRLQLDSPVLTRGMLEGIESQRKVPAARLSMVYDGPFDEPHVQAALESLCAQAEKEVRAGVGILILSDADISISRMPIDATLATAAVSAHLSKCGLKPQASIVVESGQTVSTHDLNVLLGFGASAVCPAALFDEAVRLAALSPQAVKNITRVVKEQKDYQKLAEAGPEKAVENLTHALESGVLKTMSKMGICDVESYIGGRLFEALGLDVGAGTYLGKILENIPARVPCHGLRELAENDGIWAGQHQDNLGKDGMASLGKYNRKAKTGETERALDKGAIKDIGMAGEIHNKNDRDPAMFIATDKEGDDIIRIAQTADTQSFLEMVRAEGELPAASREGRVSAEGQASAESKRCAPQKIYAISSKPNGAASVAVTFDGEGRMAGAAGIRPMTPGEIDAHAITPAYKTYAGNINAVRQREDYRPKTIADCFEIESDKPGPVNISRVEPVSAIVRRFAFGGMSLGALTEQAHAALAHSASLIGMRSNTGEGGEPHERWGTALNGGIKQMASGRFGVSAGYVANADEIEIKVVQGAKPGEGGQLPDDKARPPIAKLRRGTPGVGQVSPPPHHDIYSIEDLGQLVYDIASSPETRVSVKLGSSDGVGTIAMGVAKTLIAKGLDKDGLAGTVSIAGGSGGTGAASITSVYNTGMPYEFGVRDAYQALSSNGLADMVHTRTSGAFKTGMDVVKAAILGANEFEFGTSALLMLKCIMAGTCHEECSVGVATHGEKFTGNPQVLARYMLNVAAETREILAGLGYESLDAIRGQMQLLKPLEQLKKLRGKMDFSDLTAKLDLSPFRVNPDDLQPQPRLDDALMEALDQAKAGRYESDPKNPIRITNADRAVGGRLAIAASQLFNDPAMPGKNKRGERKPDVEEDRLTLHFRGMAGQSFGVFNHHGVKLALEGVANDGVGKSMSGGVIAIRPYEALGKAAGRHVIAGNACLYGATGGKAFFDGQAGDRFAVRNSGAAAVVEGIGDWGCEYMTAGAVINLGKAGKGFGTGMSGGIAIQYDQAHDFSASGILSAHPSGTTGSAYQDAIKTMLKAHRDQTGSARAAAILDAWEQEKHNFTVLIPKGLERLAGKDQFDAVKNVFAHRTLTPPETVWLEQKRKEVEERRTGAAPLELTGDPPPAKPFIRLALPAAAGSMHI